MSDRILRRCSHNQSAPARSVDTAQDSIRLVSDQGQRSAWPSPREGRRSLKVHSCCRSGNKSIDRKSDLSTAVMQGQRRDGFDDGVPTRCNRVFLQASFLQTLLLSTLLSLAFSLATSAVVGQESVPETRPRRVRQEARPNSYWVEQLSSDRFLRRETAQRRLAEAGPQVVPLLNESLRDSDLEKSRRIITVLARIAMEEAPAVTEGAFAALESISQGGIGAKSTLASTALEDTREGRREEARLRLTQAGIFIGSDTVALGSHSLDRPIIRIGAEWDQSEGSLAWLNWLGGIGFVVIQGEAAGTREVFEAVAKMPELTTLIISDCQLTPGDLACFRDRDRIDQIELRYVRLNDPLIESLSALPINNAIYLLGAGISDERLEQMRTALPGLEITHRQGGFLGVMCNQPLSDECYVSEVRPGSAAAAAGLRQGDVIVQIDDAKIQQFEDLQRQIKLHIPGDKILMKYRRHGQIEKTTATLGKLGD